MNLQSDFLHRLESIVSSAGELAQSCRTGLQMDLKPDGSIVTNADREVEKYLFDGLSRLAPKATFWGEESGFAPPGPDGAWLIDPIDGTSNFYFGLPLWGVTVGFIQLGRVIAGSVALPDLGWSFRAMEGQGAELNGEPMISAKPGPILPFELVGQADDGAKAFDTIPGKRRHFGAFVVEAMFVAKGGIRGLLSTKARLYDVAGSLVVLRELGYRVVTADMAPFDESHWHIDSPCGPFAVLPPEP
ncbi:MAG: inositol monophosphatase family protein [Chthonomonadaceae bacterium]|nr:inositol monophosphatase family protein [Chthonomonadaceae bacterium]